MFNPFFMSHYLYIIRSKATGKYYIGESENPETRLKYHNREGKGYTQRFRPWALVYQCEFGTRKEVLRAEKKVKSWKNRRMIERLVQGEICIKDYLV